MASETQINFGEDCRNTFTSVGGRHNLPLKLKDYDQTENFPLSLHSVYVVNEMLNFKLMFLSRQSNTDHYLNLV